MESRYSNVSIQVHIYTHSVRLLTLRTEVHVQNQKQENVSKEIILHDTSMGQRKILSPRWESNP